MTLLENPTEISQMIRNTKRSLIKKIGSSTSGKMGSIFGRISKYMRDFFPAYSYETIKNDIWKDMSAIYYKYEIDEQKQAFREIICEISEKIIERRWDKVYNKLYHAKKNQVFH